MTHFRRRIALASAAAISLLVHTTLRAEEPPLRLSAASAYVLPDPTAGRVSAQGIARWHGADSAIVWVGTLISPGALDAAVSLRLPTGATTRLRLTVAGSSREATATGLGLQQSAVVDFGRFEPGQPGPLELSLSRVGDEALPYGSIVEALTLKGPGATGTRFNLTPRRTTATAILDYAKPSAPPSRFLAETTVLSDPPGSRYVVCGWDGGQLGLAVDGSGGRRIEFIVWNRSADPTNPPVPLKLVSKGDGVVVDEPGLDMAGRCHLDHAWKAGDRHRFLLSCEGVAENVARFTGHWFDPERKTWIALATWEVPRTGVTLSGLHSLIENDDPRHGMPARNAGFGRQWVTSKAGPWQEVVEAGFSFDGPGHRERRDRTATVADGDFLLSTGGFGLGETAYGTRLTRPASGAAPASSELPGAP